MIPLRTNDAMRRAVLGVRRAECLLQPLRKALAAKRIEVARSAVVEGHSAREGPGAQQDAEHRDRPFAVVPTDRPEEDVAGGAGILRELDGVLRTGPGDRHPRHENVEQSDSDDAQDGGTGDDLLGVAGLLAVHRRRLEPHPRPEGEEEAEPGAGAHDAGGGLERPERVECLADREAIRAAAVEQHREGTQRQHEDLGHQEDAEDLGGDVDVEVGKNRVEDQHQQRWDDPVDVYAQLSLEKVLEEEREDADQRALEHHVRHGDQPTAGHADDSAQSMRDVAVEGAGGREVLGHGGVPDREQRQHHGGEDVPGRSVRTISETDGDRDVADHLR